MTSTSKSSSKLAAGIAARHLSRQEGLGRVIFYSSVAGFTEGSTGTHYAVSSNWISGDWSLARS